MTGEELTRNRVQIINEKRFGDLSEVLTPTVVTHYGQQDIHGVEQLAGALEGFSAFTDLTTSIEALVVDGDRIGVRYLTRGTHTDAFLGVEPTGRRVAFGGASM